MKFPKSEAKIVTLSNGLKIILDPNPNAPVISTQVWVGTGSIHEGRFLGAGISHLLEHMVFKGTENFDGETLSKAVQAAGGQWNAYTTFDRTVYYIDGPSDSKELFLKVLLEMVFKPTFPESEFEKEKEVIRREIDMGLDDPNSRFSRQLFETAFLQDERRQPVIGHLELFNKISHADMLEYHRARYTTENAFVSISGDFDTEELLHFLETECATIRRSFTIPVTPQKELEQFGRRESVSKFSVPATHHSMAWQGPPAEHIDAAALDLAVSILGSGRSSRFYKGIREGRKLCLHVGSWSYLSSNVTGLIAVSAELEPDKIEEFEKAVHEEILILLNDQLDTELEKVKRRTLVAQFSTLTTASGRASDLASNWFESKNLNYTSDYLSQVNAVTIHDIRRVVKTWMTSEHTLTRVTMHPEDYVDPSDKSRESLVSSKSEISEKTLINGLRYHISEDGKVPLVFINVAIKAGKVSENIETAGLNTLLASVLTKGTVSMTAEEIADTIESLGASISASSGNNTFSVRASCLMQDLERVMQILSEILISPALHNENIEQEKTVQLNNIKENKLDPASLAFENLRHQLFGNEGYGIPSDGTEESVSNLNRLALYAHHSAYFTASNMVVSFFGDVNEEHVENLAAKYLSGIKEGKAPEPKAQTVLPAGENTLHLDKEQSVLTIGFPGCSVSDSDRYALGLLNAWCSDMAGPLFTKIREELGLAYYVSSTMFFGFDCGMLAFYMGTSPEQLELAKKELLETIDTIAKNGMSESELESVKTSWLAKQALANQSQSAMASMCSVDSILGLGANHYHQTAEKIKNLTAAEIQRIAKKYFGDAQPSIVVCSPE
ncbi:insulinase family protein [Akkermansiaceae bacterium]|nr:insulinase family protein [Akkermansiaceae bacterium]